MSQLPRDFRLQREDFQFVGNGLMRPECVWADTDGLWVSDARGGVASVRPHGAPKLLGAGIVEPNGFSRRKNGNFVVAGLGDGQLYEIGPSGATTVLLSQIDGRPLGAVNCAWVDSKDRIWVSVMTRAPHWYDALRINKPDGYVILIDERGPRIVADSLSLTNEVKLSPDESYLYVCESLARRIVRFKVTAKGELMGKEVVGPGDLGPGANPDGFAFDEQGNIWLTIVTRNGISVITAAGDLIPVFEDLEPAAIDALTLALDHFEATPAHMAACSGKFLQLPTSLAFGGADRKTVYVGSLAMGQLACFAAPVGGAVSGSSGLRG